MDQNTMIIISVLLIGGFLGSFLTKVREKQNSQSLVNIAKNRANSIIQKAKSEAENLKKDKIIQAKERFLELKSEHEKMILSKDKRIAETEKRISDKETKLDNQISTNEISLNDLNSKIKDYERRISIVKKKESEIDKLHDQKVKQLESISGLKVDDAIAQLKESLKSQAKNDVMKFIQDKMEEAKLTVEQDAKKIIINTIQRIGSEEAIDNCVSVFNIESDDVKGRIIGREGRNIRAIEAATGVEIIVDDTPEAIILSCFDSIRREIARLSLHRLVTDGRIHPARIEEVVKKTRNRLVKRLLKLVNERLLS